MATIVEPIDQPDQRSTARYQQRRVGLRWYLPNLRRRQTYLNLLYLLAAFPLGTIYFVVFLTAIALCTGSLIGLVLVPPVLYSWRAVGSFERQLSIWWLDVEIAPFSLPLPPGLTFWQRLRARLGDRITWSSLAYLFVKFPRAFRNPVFRGRWAVPSSILASISPLQVAAGIRT